jgi:hypothetical protein
VTGWYPGPRTSPSQAGRATTTPRPEQSRPPRPAAAARRTARPTRSQASQPQRQGRRPQARPRPVRAVYGGATAMMTTPGGQSRSAGPAPRRPARPRRAAATHGADRRTRSQAHRRGRSRRPRVRRLAGAGCGGVTARMASPRRLGAGAVAPRVRLRQARLPRVRPLRVVCGGVTARATTPGGRIRAVGRPQRRPGRRRQAAAARTRSQTARPSRGASRVDQRGRRPRRRALRPQRMVCGHGAARATNPARRIRAVGPTPGRPARRRQAIPTYGDAVGRTCPQEARPRLAASRVNRRGRGRLPRGRRLAGASCGGAPARMASPGRLGAGAVAPRVRRRQVQLPRGRLPQLVCGGVTARTRNRGRTR